MIWNFVQSRTLRTLMMASVLISAVLVATVLGLGSAREVRNQVLSSATERMEGDAKGLAEELDQFVRLRTQALATLGAHISALPKRDAASIAPYLKRTQDQFPTFVSLFVADLNGTSFVAHPPMTPDGKPTAGVNYADRPYFQKILREKRTLADTDVFIGRVQRRALMSIAVPITDGNGQMVAVLVSGLDAGATQQVADHYKFGRSGNANVATSKGIAVATSDPKLAQDQFDFSKQPLWEYLTAAEEGQLENFPGLRNQQRLGGFATVPITQWKVWVSQTHAEVNEDVSGSYQAVLPWAGVALLVALIATWLLNVMVARPVAAMQAMATDIAAGNLDMRAPEAGPRELSGLAEAINVMAATMKRNIESERETRVVLETAVRRYGEFAGRVASGDLTARVKNDGVGSLVQLGDGLNQMTESLGKLVVEIRGASGSVASAAAEILAATSQQVSATAEEATAIRQTAATVAEVRQTAELTVRKTRSVAELAQRMTQTAEGGHRSVEESVRGSDAGKTRMESLAERILAFSEQAQAIAEINATVGELAEQSNLLAVNAGIEAAKAGEAGKGFAVVAIEVKELAERCKEATAQVRRIVVDIQKSAQGAVIAAEQGVKAAEEGATVARRSGQAIAALTESVDQAAQAAQQITAAAEQQEAGMDQISLAMQNIEQSSTQTVAATQQVERAAKDLNDLAKKLNDLVRTTKVEGK